MMRKIASPVPLANSVFITSKEYPGMGGHSQQWTPTVLKCAHPTSVFMLWRMAPHQLNYLQKNRKKEKEEERKEKGRWRRRLSMGFKSIRTVGVRYHQNILYTYMQLLKNEYKTFFKCAYPLIQKRPLLVIVHLPM